MNVTICRNNCAAFDANLFSYKNKLKPDCVARIFDPGRRVDKKGARSLFKGERCRGERCQVTFQLGNEKGTESLFKFFLKNTFLNSSLPIIDGIFLRPL